MMQTIIELELYEPKI